MKGGTDGVAVNVSCLQRKGDCRVSYWALSVVARD